MKRLLLALLCFPVCAFADNGLPTAPYIYVEGSAEVHRPPDLVTLGFTLGYRDRDQALANKKVQKQAAQVFALLDAQKIPEKDVVAESLSSEPEYVEKTVVTEKHDDSGTATPSLERVKHGELKDYHVTREFSVTVRDLAIFPKLVDDLLAMNVENFASITPALAKPEELTDEVQEKTLANAHEQAEKTLKGEHMQIESVYAVSPVPFSKIMGEMFQAEDDGRAPVFPAFTNPPDPSKYRLAPISVSQTLHVIYLIAPAK